MEKRVLTPDEARAKRADQESRGQAEAARRGRILRWATIALVVFLVMFVLFVLFRVI